MANQDFYTHFAEKKLNPLGELIKTRMYRNQLKLLTRTIDWTTIRSCLEIGLGRCDFYLILPEPIRSTLRYIGIEPSQSLGVWGHTNGILVIRSFIPPIPTRSESFDMVYMSHVIEHLGDFQTLRHALEEIHRVLKPGGHLIVAFPDYLHYQEDFYEMDYSHQYPITLHRCRTLLYDSHFQIVRSAYYNGNFFGFWRYCLQPFFYIQQTIFQGFFRLTGKRIFFKAKILFGRNIVVIARKN